MNRSDQEHAYLAGYELVGQLSAGQLEWQNEYKRCYQPGIMVSVFLDPVIRAFEAGERW